VISAGNDIVALKAVDQQRTLLPAFYSKFITTAELALHEHSALPFSAFVWLLWSVKESAYKYSKRGDADLIFSPSKIIVEQLTEANQVGEDQFKCDLPIDACYIGIVTMGESIIYFKSVVNNDFVATVILNGAVYWEVGQIAAKDYQSQAVAVRKLAMAALKQLFSSTDLHFSKHSLGYPLVYDGATLSNVPLSFSHHDRYVSYSFQIPK
jgi:phosphopantetheinyl transferase (holo-ACP synthase)